MSANDPESNGTDLDSSAPKGGGTKLPWVLLSLVTAAGGIGAWVGYEMLASERAAAAAALKASEDAVMRVKALESEKTALEAAKKALESEKGALADEVKEKDAELAKLKATYDSLEEKMKEEIAKGEIQLSQAGERIQVDMVDRILFDSGSAELSPRGQEVLARVAGVLSTVEDRLIQVSGHTDNLPPSQRIIEQFPTNWELSAARAVNVTRFLAEKGEVPERRLVAAGYGQFHPVASNATEKGRAKNRRIELLLTPALEKKRVALTSKAEPTAAKAPSTKSGAKERSTTTTRKQKPARR